jgi:hypothetical protein
MPEANLSSSSQIDTSLDSIVIPNLIEDIPGGRTLDVSAETEEVIKAGRPIIVQTSSGDHKPLAISGNAYASVPAGWTVKGILYGSVLKSKPMASIMVRGTVNEKACTDAVGLPPFVTAIYEALPLIRFTQD